VVRPQKSDSRYTGTGIDDLSNPVPPEYRSYAYDPIGNRTNATGWDEGVASSENETYTTNALNQYSQKATDNGSASGGSTDNLIYDFDGNLTEMSKSTSTVRYRYNAENRLITVEHQNPVDGDFKLEYTYDYIGRRVKKTVYTYESDLWSLTSDILFLYDDWNVVKEITTDNGQPADAKYYVWGLDMSQSHQGAGGIGGLLAAVEGSLTHYFYFDGNGNVGQLVNAPEGSIAANYEYDPFGNNIVSNGPVAENNPYRFSTKYFDSETSLYYYGYRYYSPDLGRWISRDPIGEEGGSNLLGFANNSPTNIFDPHGLDFIALAARPIGESASADLKDVNLLMSHLSIEYWVSPCPAEEGVERFSVEYRNIVKGSDVIDSVELLRDDRNWYAWKKFSAYGETSISYYWAELKVGVSVIAFNTSRANRFMAVFGPAGNNKDRVKEMWQFVKDRARNYPFGEQSVAEGREPQKGGFRGSFRNWPNSKYFFPPGNNSNSFARWIVTEMNLPIPDLFASFPGRHLPTRVSSDWSSKSPVLKQN
jgi:RHS repeat-associated protein